jgi:hypothetical protein
LHQEDCCSDGAVVEDAETAAEAWMSVVGSTGEVAGEACIQG